MRAAGADRGGRAGQRDRQAVRHRRHVLRLDLRRGPRDAGDRHEPARRQVATPARAARTPTASRPTPNGDLRRSADQAGGVAAASASPASTWSTPTTSRSRWRRAPSPARAASCPATRSTRGSPRPGTRPPGVGLISPPPHHDIYSIEDLAQLIHDLKNANPQARIHVKLVAEVGVGTVAAGVSKAHADVVLISGHDGGTGAAPADLAQARRRAVGARPGRDPADPAAQRPARPHRRAGRRPDEDRPRRDRSAPCSAPRSSASPPRRWWSSGCVMMRVCHLDTCPVGVATQNPVLRKRFTGKPEFVVTFFEYIAEEVREYLAALGFRIARRGDRATPSCSTWPPAIDHWKADGLDLTPILHVPERPFGGAAHCHQRRRTTAWTGRSTTPLIQLCEGALDDGRAGLARPADPQRQPHRRHDARLTRSPALRRRRACPTARSAIALHRLGGPELRRVRAPRASPCGWSGDANDYVGKGLSGGRIMRAAAGRRSPLRGRGQHHRRQRDPLRRHRRARSSCAAWSVSGSACATPARRRSSRASATTAAST